LIKILPDELYLNTQSVY